MTNSSSLAVQPEITVEVYDTSVPADRMGDVVSEDIECCVTIKYRASCDGFGLGMALASQSDDGLTMHVGMVISKITSEEPRGVTRGPKTTAKYRVLFSNGGGMIVDLEEVTRMRRLFLDAPGLQPVVVAARSVDMDCCLFQ